MFNLKCQEITELVAHLEKYRTWHIWL